MDSLLDNAITLVLMVLFIIIQIRIIKGDN